MVKSATAQDKCTNYQNNPKVKVTAFVITDYQVALISERKEKLKTFSGFTKWKCRGNDFESRYGRRSGLKPAWKILRKSP